VAIPPSLAFFRASIDAWVDESVFFWSNSPFNAPYTWVMADGRSFSKGEKFQDR
jgi:hypothetical protein